ncbi:DUF4352 domain-containing protein [Bifidobacterium psychraerophilum]|uniref:DUF4352 domain-containing protein n=1 Tax=Bifidobacterium psychraerophilum TaxID=218140 RepID=UPI0039E8BA96
MSAPNPGFQQQPPRPLPKQYQQPVYGQPIRPQYPPVNPKRMRPYKFFYEQLGFWITVVIVAFVALMLGIGIGGADSPSTSKVSSSNSSASSEAKAKTDNSSSSKYEVGSQILVNDTEVVVSKVDKDWKSNDEFTQPATGKKFVLITVQLVNKSSNKVAFNRFDWKLQDANGAIGDAYLLSGSDDIGSGELAPGGSKSGTVLFEIDSSAIPSFVRYQPSWLSSKDIEVKL